MFYSFYTVKNFLYNSNYGAPQTYFFAMCIARNYVRFLDCALDLEFLYSFVHKNRALISSFILWLLTPRPDECARPSPRVPALVYR